MALTVQRYSETAHARMWERFVWKSNNGTLFHTRRFLSYHPPERFKDHSLVFLDGHDVLALFPAIDRTMDGKRILSSHGGASYGGFVFPETLSVRAAFDLVELLLSHAKQQHFAAIEITFPPDIYSNRPNDYLPFALHRNGFRYKKREISSVIPLDFGVESVLQTFKPEARTALRRSLKLGTLVRENDDLASFYPILQKNLAMRHHVKPTHTLEELQKLKKMFPDRIRHFGAFAEGRMVAGVTNFICNDRVVLAFYISHDEEYQKYRPVNHLFYAIIRWCIENRFRFLDYGIFTVNEEPNWGLGKFKESFGARGVLRDTFLLEL